MPAPSTTAPATSFAVSSTVTLCCTCSLMSSLRIAESWQARRESNPQPAVLETAALPIELLAYDLLQNFGDDARADGLAALADGEAQTLLHRDRGDQLDDHLDVVAGHDHLDARRQLHRARHVGRAEVELRTIALEERRVTPALFLRQHVHLGFELRVRLDAARLAQHLTTLHFFALRAAQQYADVVARLPLVQQLAEHLNARADRLLRVTDADDLNLVVHLDDAALDTPGHHRAAAGDREHVFHRHQERAVDGSLRHRNPLVHLIDQLEQRGHPQRALVAFQRLQRRARDDRGLVPRKLVLRQQLAHFHLDQLEQLRVIHHVRLVQVHQDVRHAHLARQQDVLARLRHRAVSSGYHQNRAVHLRGAGDHVLHVVSVPRAINVRVVPQRRLVLDVRGRDRDAARPLFGRLVDLVVRLELTAVLLGHHLGQGSRQRRLAMIDVADRAYVYVRLGALKFLFGHSSGPLNNVCKSWSPRPGLNR